MVNDKTLEEARASRETVEHDLLRLLGFFGHYLHVHAGGRSGKQHILTKLLTSEGHLTQRELLEMSNVSSASLSEVLAKLEAEGLVTRTRSAQDGRQLDVILTEAGAERAGELVQSKLEFERSSFSVLTEEEKLELRDTLVRVQKHWKEDEKDKEMACQTSSKN